MWVRRVNGEVRPLCMVHTMQCMACEGTLARNILYEVLESATVHEMLNLLSPWL